MHFCPLGREVWLVDGQRPPQLLLGFFYLDGVSAIHGRTPGTMESILHRRL